MKLMVNNHELEDKHTQIDSNSSALPFCYTRKYPLRGNVLAPLTALKELTTQGWKFYSFSKWNSMLIRLWSYQRDETLKGDMQRQHRRRKDGQTWRLKYWSRYSCSIYLRDEWKFAFPSGSVLPLIKFLARIGINIGFVQFGLFHQILNFIRCQTSPFDMLCFLLMHSQDVFFGSKTFAAYCTISQSRITYNKINIFNN